MVRLFWCLYSFLTSLVALGCLIGLAVIAIRGASTAVAYWVLVGFVIGAAGAHLAEHKLEDIDS